MTKFVLNNASLTMVRYPNGEIDFKDNIRAIKELNLEYNKLSWFNCTYADILLLDKINKIIPIHEIYIDYFPYQRSDRDFFDNYTGNNLVSTVYTQVIQALPYLQNMQVNDPHSEILRAKVTPVYPIIEKVTKYATRNSVLVYPDNNAYLRYHDMCKHLSDNYIVIHKSRDVQTGQVLDSKVVTANLPSNFVSNIIVIDDICDGGNTFLKAKQAVQEFTYNLQQDYSLTYWILAVSHMTNCDLDRSLLYKQFIIA